MFKKSVLALAMLAVFPALHAGGAAAQPAVAAQAMPAAGRTWAQTLVDQTIATYPDLLLFDVHAIPPDGTESVIIAAKDAARIGRKSPLNEVEVEKTGAPRVEINPAGNQNVEVEVPLYDINRRIVGVVEMAFPYVAGTDKEALILKAATIANQLGRRIGSRAMLFDPLQLDPGVPIAGYAQYLIDEALARHRNVEVIAIRAHPAAGRTDYPIVASNVGRIGKPPEPPDSEVLSTGKVVTVQDVPAARLEVKVPLQDATRASIGELTVVFPYPAATDEAPFIREAERIRDEMSPRIAGEAALRGAYPIAAVAPSEQAIQDEYNKPELGNTQSLPMTKSVVSGNALEDSKQDGYSEAVKGVAGVMPTNSKGSANDAIGIRGIKVNLFSNYRLNGGLPITGVITTPTENKERIETLKGANALMFGVASPAGIINLVTKRAGERDVTSLGLGGNSFGQFGVNADIGRRFGPSREFGLRLNGSATHYENGVRGTGGMGDFWSGGFDWQATSRLSFQIDYEYFMRRVGEQAGISLANPVNGVIPITPVPDPRNRLTGPWQLYNPHTRDEQFRTDYVINDNWKVLAETGRSDSDRSRYTVRIGGYNLVTGAGGVPTVTFTHQEYKNAFSRVETLGRFDTWFLKHNLTIGVSKSERDTLVPLQVAGTITQKQNIFDPIELPAPVINPANAKALPLQASADVAAYGYDTIEVTPQWKVLLGLRNTKDEETGVKGTITTRVNNPAYGVLYDVLPSLTLFASYMEGLESGGVAPATAVNFNEQLPSAVSKQKEIGIRDSHIRGLSLNASYFQISRANAVTDPVTKIFSNSGEIDYSGVELTASYQLTREWSVNTAGMWLKSKQRSPDPTFNGFAPENTPKAIGNLSVQYRPVYAPGLTLNAGLSAIGSRFVNNQEQGTIPGYTLYSIGANYATRLYGKRVSYQLSVDNLMNKRYWNSVQTGTYGIGMDRSLKFNAKIDF